LENGRFTNLHFCDLPRAVRISKAYKLVTTGTTGRASWAKAGFEYCKRDDTYYLLVNDGKIRGMPEFFEVWRINFPIESLSARARSGGHEATERERWGVAARANGAQGFRMNLLSFVQNNEM
jgi:hypothetical protein